MTRFLKKIALLVGGVAVALSGVLAGSPAQATEQVDVELVLAVDVSGSMSEHELRIQRQGYTKAFRSDQVIAAIEAGLIGAIAVTYVEWAGEDLQRHVIPWMKIANADDAYEFADRLASAPRGNMNYTSISGAITTAMVSLESNHFTGMRQVIDVSGDGMNNQGIMASHARDEAVSRGIIINGLPLMTDPLSFRFKGAEVSLDTYYQFCVIGGPGSFLIPVTNWNGFADAVRRKIIMEVASLSPARDTRRLPVVRAQFLDIAPPTVDCSLGKKVLGIPVP
ncbi:MAG: DUF1194 domain-containing protein [Pseudomonadota bacterium]